MNKTAASEKIADLVKSWEEKLVDLSEDVLTRNKNSQKRTVKQIIGHLIDSASNNHQRMVRLQYNPHLDFPDYTQDNDRWIALQKYQDENWQNLVHLWVYFNLHIAWIIKNSDDSMAPGYWIDCVGTKISLEQMIEGYCDHLCLHLDEIQKLISV